MATLQHRRLRAAWVALLLLGLIAASGVGGVGGRPARLQAAERALPAVTAVAVSIGPGETTTPRQDARILVTGPWSPGHPTTFVLAAAAVALALPRFGRWRCMAHRGRRCDGPAEHQAARGPPRPSRPLPRQARAGIA
ncbi:hypothetical protein [Frankia sp. ACN1ag]|uniref:hypothetical protein n=1 Tax=Frankia sp. ACN1ag TaxID=102891 RepID=UPI0006DC87B7|nr:hypothetical protein [Frankia sp. ACN1ag]KQC36403.1 hypothetical protein UK82_21525 [Frankia sp. ACN1ag]